MRNQDTLGVIINYSMIAVDNGRSGRVYESSEEYCMNTLFYMPQFIATSCVLSTLCNPTFLQSLISKCISLLLKEFCDF
jgi:hypothetical protein